MRAATSIVPDRSRAATPIVSETESPIIVPETETPIRPEQQTVRRNTSQETPDAEKRLENILIKQGRQIRALYQLQKSTNDGVTWIQEQMKKQNEGKTDLSAKVFSVS